MPKTISTFQTYGVTLTPTDNPLTVTSTGTIQSPGTYGVEGPANIYSYGPSGTITSGPTITPAPSWTVSNSGLITAAGTNSVGVELQTNSTVSNTAGGRIAGNSNGIYLTAGGSVSNAGYIGGYDSVVVDGAAGTVTNTSGGSIYGDNNGVRLGGGGNVTNAGTITGAGYGGGFGVSISGGAGTVTNAGTIRGGPNAIQFVGTFNDRLLLAPGAVLQGAVVGQTGAGATNTLELVAGTASAIGTLTRFSSQFSNFGTIAVDGNASWALAGTGETISAGIALGGTLSNIETGTVVLSGTISGPGTLVQNSVGTLSLTGPNSFTGGTTLDVGTLDVAALNSAGTGAVTFGPGGSATLRIEQASLQTTIDFTNYPYNYAYRSSFGNAIAGFATANTVDVRGVGTDTVAFNYATDVLTLTGSNQTTTLQLSGSYTGYAFLASADGAGGTNVTLAPAAVPTITGTHATATTSEAAVTPFSGVTIGDMNANSTETLTIALSGGGGMLSDGAGYSGLVRNADGTYALQGSATAVTGELDALSFTPSAGAAGSSATTQFRLTDTTTSGTSATDTGTSVTNTDPAVPPQVNTDTVSIDSQVSFQHGAFTLSGTAFSAAGVTAVEISALVDGTQEDLGAASLNDDGTFTFVDKIGAHQQGFLTATLMDAAGGVASSADPGFSLTGGLHQNGFVARQTTYTSDQDGVASTSLFRPYGLRQVDVTASGQTLTASSFSDTFLNHGAGDNTFVFDPGFGLDFVRQFRVGGANHDTISLQGSDFGNSIAEVLNNTRDAGGSAVITDPTSGDAIKLTGVTKNQLVANQSDFTFHGG